MVRSRRPTTLKVCAPPSHGRSGATLIEMLVVIALISLLISIMIPSLKRSMEVASDTICMHNLREIGYSLRLYRVENDGWLPVSKPRNPNAEEVIAVEPWFVKLFPNYLDNAEILSCPDDPFGDRMAKVNGRLDDPRVADYPSYGLSSFIATGANGIIAELDRRRPARPHDTILVADIGPDDIIGGSLVADASGPDRNASLLAWDDGFDPFEERSSPPWLVRRHGRGINVLTLTGGVRDAVTTDLIRKPIRRYYDKCAAGGCTFCNELRAFHYSFARDRLYWWTGPVPSE